ncbi:MAG: YegP family protein, partial [Pseudomonadota bacterium]
MAGKFEIYKDKAGEFRFRLKAGNGETILTGEGYKAKSGVQNGIESIRKNASDAARFEVKEAKNGGAFFVLKAANHQVIGQSQIYSSTSACENGIASVGNAV